MKRHIQGIALLAFTFFFAFAPTCGVAGMLLNRASHWLLGQTGSALLALTTFTIGVLLIVPPAAWVRFVRWVFTGKKRERVGQAGPVAKVIPIRPPPVPRETAAVTDARGGLTFLGYSKGEIDLALARVNCNGTADEIIRAALKLLRKAV